MQARSEAFLAKWQRRLRLKQRTLSQLTEARQAVSEEKLHALKQQISWISELLT